MATRKFSTFEYASLTDAGKSDKAGLHRVDAFETPHGHAFVIVSSEQDDEQQAELCGIAIERIKYYLENEPDEKIDDVSRNALIYTGGYLYQIGQKDPLQQAGKISSLCVLFSDERIYYSWAGNVELFLFTGRRMYLLSWKEESDDESVHAANEGEKEPVEQHGFLGRQAIMAPFSGNGPIEPVNGDMLIMASGSVCRSLHTKDIKRVLQDSMPMQTKAARIMRHSSTGPGECPASIMLLRFHGLNNTERSFGDGQVASKHDSLMKKTEQDSEMGKQSQGKTKKRSFRTLKTVFGIIGLIIVGYLFYDLFINDPHPPVRVAPTVEEAVVDTDEQVIPDEAEVELADEPVVLPDDVTYVVRGGDTWGRIYTQYGVCSWFIINHPPNTGKFGREGSLIAGQRLDIPLKYSGKAEYNPHYYREFTTDKVGSRCENAGRDFLRAFEAKIAE